MQAKGSLKARLVGRLRSGRVRRVSLAERRAVYNQDYLDAVALERNGRPRQTLGWPTPIEKFNAILLKAGDVLTT